MNIDDVLQGVTSQDVAKAKEIDQMLEDSEWKAFIDGELWDKDRSKIVYAIAYARLSEVE
ncbi:AB1gp18 [Acinetobacter phage AB1]|uniref:AB1gp18 n=1 Tax=Acinetobacter phage AB1 TaxID=889876 RepID=E2GLV6_9CAUD|nr:AB1gp18 [Acinetobacter phage AB1]ADO14389.1 AB1gp18 [Acinetobacter phage AB1]